jgi:hypothetical protein
MKKERKRSILNQIDQDKSLANNLVIVIMLMRIVMLMKVIMLVVVIMLMRVIMAFKELIEKD